jgi:hypothetical protein
MHASPWLQRSKKSALAMERIATLGVKGGTLAVRQQLGQVVEFVAS